MTQRLRYYFDKHMPLVTADQLPLGGIDTLTTTESGRANQKYSDESQVRYAAEQGCVLVTEDSDFITLSATQQPHAAIVYFPIALAVGPCVEYLELLALTTTPSEIANQLFYGRW
ncbi:MAG: DUF5615 family PIN-like protein [Ktedonobacterales bacterium]